MHTWNHEWNHAARMPCQLHAHAPCDCVIWISPPNNVCMATPFCMQMPIWDHLEELRERVLVSALVSGNWTGNGIVVWERARQNDRTSSHVVCGRCSESRGRSVGVNGLPQCHCGWCHMSTGLLRVSESCISETSSTSVVLLSQIMLPHPTLVQSHGAPPPDHVIHVTPGGRALDPRLLLFQQGAHHLPRAASG